MCYQQAHKFLVCYFIKVLPSNYRKEYLEFPWAELRSMVEPSFAERSLICHTDYLTDATIVASSAVNITENAVLTADGQSHAYDYLVIATGHAMTSPGSRAERIKEFQRGKQNQSTPWINNKDVF
jgi:apoptosis-inducing factor 2